MKTLKHCRNVAEELTAAYCDWYHLQESNIQCITMKSKVICPTAIAYSMGQIIKLVCI